MITYLTHNQIDTQQWDECIANSPNGNVYAWSWYLDIVHPNWDALVEDDYESVMPLTGNKKFFLNYLHQPFFTQQLGVFSKKSLNVEKIELFINSTPKKYKFAEIRLNAGNKCQECIQGIEYHRNIELSLSSDYNTLYKNYNSNTKRDIKKARAANLFISEDIEASEIVGLFRKSKGELVKHWGDVEYDRFLNLVKVASERGYCFVKGVKNIDNQLIAGAVFMKSHNRIVFLFSGADKLNKDLHALSLLLDELIKEYSGTETILDFEGSDNDGLARYYKGFGGYENPYPSLYFNKECWIVKLLIKLFKNK